MDGEQVPTGPTPSVPFWALDLVRDVASIKQATAVLPRIEMEVDAIRTEAVPMREHEAVIKRTDALWDAYQRLRGAAWLLGVVQLITVTYLSLHAAGVVR